MLLSLLFGNILSEYYIREVKPAFCRYRRMGQGEGAVADSHRMMQDRKGLMIRYVYET